MTDTIADMRQTDIQDSTGRPVTTLTVNNKLLAPIMARAASIASRNSAVPILGCVLLRSSPAYLIVDANNLEMALRQGCAASGPERSVCVDAGSLNALLRQIPSDAEVQFTFKEGLGMNWNEQTSERLRRLWLDGRPTAEIGRMMKCSKGAIVGRARRLKLPPRPSPIRRDPSAPAIVYQRLRPCTLPPLSSLSSYNGEWITPERIAILARDYPTMRFRMHILEDMAALPGPMWPNADAVSGYARNVLHLSRPADFVAMPRGARKAPVVSKPPVIRKKPEPPAPRPEVFFKPITTGRPCQWPFGDPGIKGFRFCERLHANHDSYCDEHHRIAYVRVRQHDALRLAVMGKRG